jgi:hypothetical protein
MPRDPRDRCVVDWEDRYGTTVSGNLPQYKKNTCIEDTIDLVSIQAFAPWVNLSDFHYYHVKCPYSTATPWHYVLDTNPSSPTYWQSRDVANEAVEHTATSGIMIKHVMGSKNGWLCVDPQCPCFLGTVSGSYSGVRYFYY